MGTIYTIVVGTTLFTVAMSNEQYFSRAEDGALTLADSAWVSAESPGTYSVFLGDVKDNTEYAHKASASNKAEMYAARQLSIKYPSGDLCPVLAVDKVRVLGTAPKPDTVQRYGKEFIRLAVPTPVIRTLCSKVGAKIKLNSPAIEKSTEKDEYTVFTVGIPASCALGTIVKAEDSADEVSTEVVGLHKDMNTFCEGVDFEAACTFVVRAKYKGRTVPLGEISGYALVLEPCSITITDVYETMFDPTGSVGLPKVDLGTSVPTTSVLS